VLHDFVLYSLWKASHESPVPIRLDSMENVEVYVPPPQVALQLLHALQVPEQSAGHAWVLQA